MGVALWMLAAGLVVVLGVAVVAFARAGVRGRGESSVIRVTFWVALLWAGIAIIGALVTAVSTLVQSVVQITVPTAAYWPTLPEGAFVEGASATRTGGGFTAADVVVEGLSVGARVCWAIGQALWWLVPGAVAAMVALSCLQLLRGRAFAPVLSRMSMVTAVVVCAGGIGAQVLSDIAGSMASTELLSYSGGGFEEVAGIDDVLKAWWPDPMFSVTVPFWPIAAGLAFAALAVILRHGTRLQRDTEGLV
ncbi:hypothetical protein V2S04_02820 [Microbacterium sp. OR21]|uniref:hypothetical protein n=1 Tax=Microbacterium sp. OR21 TaxID=3095346 RepID=UPI0039B48C6C